MQTAVKTQTEVCLKTEFAARHHSGPRGV